MHDAFAAQLEGTGAFWLLVNAHVCETNETALVELLERMPLPDGPSGAMLRLLDAAALGGYALPAPLPPSALEVLQSSAGGDSVAALRLSAHIHSAAAYRAGYLRCFELSLAHHLTALRLGLAAVEAGRQEAHAPDDEGAILRMAERSYKAAGALLTERLVPSVRLMSSNSSASLEARRSQFRTLDELRNRLEACGGDAGAATSASPRVVNPAAIHAEEAAEGMVTPLTLAQLAASC